MDKEIHVVTGALGYSGKYIAKYLLDKGYKVRTLTNSYNRTNPFGNRIEVYPYNFEDYEKLVESLYGSSVLYNTYWVRFNYSRDKMEFNYSIAFENTLKLFKAAKEAGVRRIVHISITNPSEDSPLEYFRNKAKVERSLINSNLSYAILRPAVLFGKEGILINNIAWMLRTFPIFGVFGDGNYRLQPIYVSDLAQLAVEEGNKSENVIIDAIGPETFTYRELVKMIGEIIDKRRLIISIPDPIGYILGKIIGKFVGDVIITRDEIEGLRKNLLYTNSPPIGKTKLTDWIRENASTLGVHYANELVRRRNKPEEE